MPGYKFHYIFSFLVTGLVLYFVVKQTSLLIDSISYFITIPLVIYFYALLPDIDTPASKARKYVTVGCLGLIIYAAYLNNILRLELRIK